MNWKLWRHFAWIDTRSRFVSRVRPNGSLLDLGSSDGSTLRHFRELRPDISLASADIAGSPDSYPRGTDFHRADFEADVLPWADETFDAVTCMHVVEHLSDVDHLLRECARVLKPGGLLYIETPHENTVAMASVTGRAAGSVTMNFHDDPTHVRPVPVSLLASISARCGLLRVSSGTSRNWGFAAAYPLLRIVRPDTKQRHVARQHLMGWSVFMIATRRHLS